MEQRPQLAVLNRGRDHASLVPWAADPAESHGESALGRVAAPRVGAPDQPGDLLRRNVTDPPDLGRVAGPVDPCHHLPDVAHGPALQREVSDLDDRLVAELKRGQFTMPAPDLGAPLAAPDDGGNPCVPR